MRVPESVPGKGRKSEGESSPTGLNASLPSCKDVPLLVVYFYCLLIPHGREKYRQGNFPHPKTPAF